MAQLTVRQAAEQVGVTRQTMYRCIASGRVSATTAHDGEKQIDSAELLRAFGRLQAPSVTAATRNDRPRQTRAPLDNPMSAAIQVELERLRLQLEFKAAELAMAQQRIDELKQRERDGAAERERLLALLEQSTRLLAAPPAPAQTVSSPPMLKPKKASKKP